MALGYRGNPEWRDMSDFVVHFTKGAVNKSPIAVLSSILASRTLTASSPFGAARSLWMLGDTQRAVCFSEIPLDMLDRLLSRRSSFGIGFHQSFLSAREGARVWYLDKDRYAASAFNQVLKSKIEGGINKNDPFWTLTLFVDFPGHYEDVSYRFEWEREWRHAGDLEFDPPDVSFLFVPEIHHSQIRSELPDYLCPLIDPTWSMERIQDAVAELEEEQAFDGPAEMEVQAWASQCVHCGGDIWDGMCQICGLQEM
jgi:hypothetical protein